MDEVPVARHREKLEQRRKQVTATLGYLKREQREVENNTDWLDRAAYENRVKFLDRMTGWYIDELAQIDGALGRVRARKFGLCLACHKPIEAKRLEVSPTISFCLPCQQMQEAA